MAQHIPRKICLAFLYFALTFWGRAALAAPAVYLHDTRTTENGLPQNDAH